MPIRPIYLDNLATTRVDPRVLEAMLPWLDNQYGNASSTTHEFGWEAARAVEVARNDLSDFIGARLSSEIVFTSGATESNNAVLKGIVEGTGTTKRHIVSTEIEHPSLLATCEALRRQGHEVTFVKPDGDGIVDPDEIGRAIRNNTCLVSVMLANNEVGSIQPIKEISRITRPRKVPLHVDAAQALGKVEFLVEALGIDLASFSAHKLYGPKGVGAIYVPTVLRHRLQPLLHGGGQEFGFRSGTLPVAQIVGFGVAARIAATQLREDAERAALLRSELWSYIVSRIPEIRLNGSTVHRLPGCLNFSVPGILADAVIGAIPELALSSGSACSSHHGGGSHVLRAMGLDASQQRSALRIGIGRFNTAEEIQHSGELLVDTILRLRSA